MEDGSLDNEKKPDAEPMPAPQTQTSSNPPAAPEAEPQLSLAEVAAAQAANLRDVTGAVSLYIAVSSSLAPGITTDAFKVYRARLLQESGNPTDPIEIMLIEQIALAHFHIGRLQLKSCSVAHGPLAIAYADAATRLASEFRRSVLALEDFRAKQAARKAQAVGQEAILSKQNGKPHQPSSAKKKATPDKQVRNGNSETPEWLKKRMQYPTPNGSKLAAAAN